MTIKNLPVRYSELGRCRLGEKVTTTKDGKKVTRPTKGEYLRFTSNDRLYLEALAAKYGGTVEEWPDGEQLFQLTTESAFVSVLLPPDPIDTSYERWGSGGIAKRCDGELALVPVQDGEGGFMEERPCLCRAEELIPGDRADMKKGACQVTLRMRLVLPDVPGIGVWLCTSHSIYGAMELPGQVELLQTIAAKGILIPAEFGIEKRTEKKPWERYARDFIVPVLRVRASLADLAAGAGMPRLEDHRAALAPPAAALGSGDGQGGEAQPVTGHDGITEPQLRKLHALLHKHGIAEADRHEQMSRMLGWEVHSAKDLTKNVATKLIDTLESMEAEDITKGFAAGLESGAEKVRTDIESMARNSVAPVFLKAVVVGCAKIGLEGPDADAMVTFATGKASINDLIEPTEANAVFDAIKRFKADELGLRYREDGTAEVHEKVEVVG